MPILGAIGRRTENGRRQRLALVLLVLVVFLPVVAGSARGQETTSPDLIGVFTVTIGEPDLPPGLAGGAVLFGLWTVTFNADGTYSLDRQDVGRIVSGTYDVAGSTLTFGEWSGIVTCGALEAQTSPAAYAWRLDETGLTLTPINDGCAERKILLGTRPFASFEACTTTPLGAMPLPQLPVSTPTMSEATPVGNMGVAAQEGLATAADPEETVDRVLAQGTACWATRDPARFLPLHSRRVLADLSLVGPLPEFASTLQSLMAVPLSFQRIGNLTVVDSFHAWAYVEVTLGGDPLPQRIDFVYEDGSWLMDTFFLFGPAPDDQPEP